MISLVVTADTKNYNLVERDQAFANLMIQFKQPFEIVYVANADYGFLGELKKIVSNNPNRKLVVTAPSTNINTQIYMGLDQTENGDCLLITMDTDVELIKKMLMKHFDGADLVFVKKKENWFKSFFVGLGRATYQIGLRLLGRGRDLCCDPRVVLLNNRSVNTIILNPVLSKALRLVNPDPEREARVLTEEKLYDNPTPSQQNSNNSFMALGIVSLFYIIALFVMAIIFPIFNSGLYTVWILVGIIVWVILGVIGAAVVARFVYNTRLGIPVAINLANEPVINIEEIVRSGDTIEFTEEENEADAVDKNQPEPEIVKESEAEGSEHKADVVEKSELEPGIMPEDINIEESGIIEAEDKDNIEEEAIKNKDEVDTKKLATMPDNEIAVPETPPATKKSSAKAKTKKSSTTTKTAEKKDTTAKKSTKKSTAGTSKKPQISKVKSTRSPKTKK